MSIYESVLLTMIEIYSMYNIWGKIERRIEKNIFKKALICSIVLLLFSVLNHYKIKNDFVIIYVTIVLLNLILFKIPKKYIVFEFVVVFGIIIITQLLLTYLIIRIEGELEYTFISGLKVNIVLFILSVIIKKNVPINKLLTIYKQNFKKLNISVIFVVIPVIIFINFWKDNDGVYIENLKPTIIYIMIWLIISIYFIFNGIKLIQKDKKLKIQKLYNSILKELVGDLRKVQHDHKNHLTTILAMIESENKGNSIIQDYIENVIGKSKDVNVSLNIKNPVLNAIVYSKMTISKSQNIDFLILFKNQIPNYEVEDYELVEILGNILDNAIDANLDYDGSDKKIILELGTENGRKIIRVGNTANIQKMPSVENMFKTGYSTKEGKLRGYGLSNVKAIVKIYKGVLEFSIEDDLVNIKILLQ